MQQTGYGPHDKQDGGNYGHGDKQDGGNPGIHAYLFLGGRSSLQTSQVFTVADNWTEETITWNNAPQAVENVRRSWVPWLSSYPGADGIPRTWDVTSAVSEAYLTGKPLRLALYSADSERHSGKYFWSSEFDLKESRPSLDISWADP